MIKSRRAGERGETRTGWLDSRHTFSFGDYYDPQQMGFKFSPQAESQYLDTSGARRRDP